MTAAELVLDHLETLVSDWRTHLRARNRSRAIIASYERCAIALRAFLVSRGMPTSRAAIAREHAEAFLADLADRVARPPPRSTTGHFSSCSDGSKRTARSPAPHAADEAPARAGPASARARRRINWPRCLRPARATRSRTARAACACGVSVRANGQVGSPLWEMRSRVKPSSRLRRRGEHPAVGHLRLRPRDCGCARPQQTIRCAGV
jgi:hypothetical protein